MDEQAILTAERLRDDLGEFRRLLGSRYSASRQVSSEEHRKQAARLAETWLAEVALNQDVGVAIGSATLADLNVHFQRILTFAEHATTKKRYDQELRAILNNYSVKVIVPLKQSRGRQASISSIPRTADAQIHSAFIGQSFASSDSRINQCVADTLDALGVRIVTGQKPKADFISEKVKRLIEDQSVFIGVFTRRDKIAGKREWTTSAWVIDEKAYALGRQKRLIRIKEQGVVSIGGIQGDYEYLEFSRENLETLPIRLIQLFTLTNLGLRT